jgi:hypothetical protein
MLGRCQSMDGVMGKHGIRYATTTLLMRGGRNLKMACIINNWCDEKLLEVLKIRNGRI